MRITAKRRYGPFCSSVSRLAFSSYFPRASLELGPLLLLGRVGADVLEGPQDVGGDWWWGGDVSTGGPVTVGVSHPRGLVQLTLGVVVLGHAVGDDASLALLGVSNAVARFEGVCVVAVVEDLAGLSDDVGVPVDVPSGARGHQEGGGELEGSGTRRIRQCFKGSSG